jgi:hypothetical protein
MTSTAAPYRDLGLASAGVERGASRRGYGTSIQIGAASPRAAATRRRTRWRNGRRIPVVQRFFCLIMKTWEATRD